MRKITVFIALLMLQMTSGLLFGSIYPVKSEKKLFNQNEVFSTGSVYGTVTCGYTYDSLFGVVVSSGNTTTQTDTNGYYELTLDAGSDTLEFSFPGYLTDTIITVVVTGSVTEENLELYAIPHPISWVLAEVNEDETQCLVTWSKPMGTHMILYDDNEVDDHLIWTIPGNAVGVRFSPLDYPATVTGGKINVGDGGYPAGANFIGTQFAAGIIDDDGTNGLPGTVLDSVVVDVINYNWIDFVDVFDNTFEEGDFYIVMWQLDGETNSAPIAIDTNLSSFYNSVVYQQGMGWNDSPGNNFMIRAYVYGPYYIENFSPLPYTIARITNFDPDLGPETGTLTPIANPSTEIYNDAPFGGHPEGFIAYAINMAYYNNSQITYSNIVNKGIENTVTLELTHCMNNLPEGIEVTLIGSDYPYQEFFTISDTTGIVVFNDVVDGSYYLKAYKPGYEIYEDFDLQIVDNLTYSIILDELVLPPQNLVVDSSTSVATWDDPTILKLPKEKFENGIFPPDGWQSSSLGIGWYASDDGGSPGWVIPPGDGYYALSNDKVAGTSNEGGSDYLIAPMLDLSDCISYQIKFDYFFDGSDGQSAFFEYSLDTGVTWILIDSLVPVAEWTKDSIDLTFLSGPSSTPVLLAFHSDDNGGWASGLAIDNVEVVNFPLSLIGYYIYLDGMFVAQLPSTVRTYTFVDLIYGQTYAASVRTLRECGLSDPSNEVIWESTYLHPPRNLTTNYIYGTDSVPIMFNPPLTGTIPMNSANMVSINELNSGGSKIMGQQQFSFPDLVAAGEAGCETDGEFIFTVLPDGFVKYDIDGNLIEQFSIPGVSNIKDLAYDGEFFYGAAANTTVFVMDFSTHTLVTTFTAPTDVRAIAYSLDDGTFYANNWGTDIVNFDVAGNNLGSFIPSVSAIYGLAFDNWSIQSVNTLWAYDQGENNVIQFALPDGAPTGFVHNLPCMSGLAGGLFTYPGLYEEGKVTIGGNAQDDKVWGIELTDYSTTLGLIPDGLSSFNIYQNTVVIANMPYENQTPEELLTYIVEPLPSGTYLFCASAVYDLTNYGYPGQSETSQIICGDSVEVIWGSVIPYFENWNNGTFENWTLNENIENWSININEGEPAPSAQFSGEPLLQNDYSSTLTSEPIIVDSITEGTIYLDFDLKLVNNNPTGEEKLLVEIYNGLQWDLVAEYANNGKSNFNTKHIDITEFIEGSTFSVRFNVTGQYSIDIVSWFIDNISITRQCASPQNLTGEYIWNNDDELGVEICWEIFDSTSRNTGSIYNNEIELNLTGNSREIEGFNIYRKEMNSPDYELYDMLGFQSGQTSYCYYDGIPNVSIETGYYYQVTANYASDIDNCESLPGNALEIPEDDFVYVYVTGIESGNGITEISVFPNPARDKFNIVSKTEKIIRLTLFDNIGQVKYLNYDIRSNNIMLSSSLFSEGVYFIKIETETTTQIKKLIIL